MFSCCSLLFLFNTKFSFLQDLLRVESVNVIKKWDKDIHVVSILISGTGLDSSHILLAGHPKQKHDKSFNQSIQV